MNNDENKDFIIINENGENVTPEDNKINTNTSVDTNTQTKNNTSNTNGVNTNISSKPNTGLK